MIFSGEKGAQRGSWHHRVPCPYSLTSPYLIPYGMASHQLQLAAQAPYASFNKLQRPVLNHAGLHLHRKVDFLAKNLVGGGVFINRRCRL